MAQLGYILKRCLKVMNTATGLVTGAQYQQWVAPDGSFYRMDCNVVGDDGKLVKYGEWFAETALPALGTDEVYVDCDLDEECVLLCVIRDVDWKPTRFPFKRRYATGVSEDGTIAANPTDLDLNGVPFELEPEEVPEICPDAKAYELDCIYTGAAGDTVTIPGLIHNDLCITLANVAPGQPVTEDLVGTYNGGEYTIPASKFCPEHKITAQADNCLFGLGDVEFTVPAGHSLCISGTKIESGTGDAKVKTKAVAEKTAE